MTNIPFDQASVVENQLNRRLPEYLEILRQMVEINSFTYNPEGVNRVGDFTARIFQNLGFIPEFVPSVRKEFGKHLFLSHPAKESSAPMLALISHLDTVFSPEEERANNFVWRPEGNRIYGPGCVDVKGGTLMIFMVLETLKLHFPEFFHRVNWLVCLNASEEALSEDFSKNCLHRLTDSTRACLVFEAGNINDHGFKMVVARKGRAYFHVNVEGRSAHAGNNHDFGANAIVQLAGIVQRIANLTDYNRNLTFNVGTIRGGTVVNRVPHHASAEVEMRTFLPDVFLEGLQRISQLEGISEIKSSVDGYPCKVTVRVLEQTMPWPENEETHRLFRVWETAAESLGMQVIEEKRGGLSDGNFFWNHIPTLDGLGPAGNNAHCSEHDPQNGKEQEYVSVKSFVPKAVMNIFAIQQLLAE